MKKHAVYMLAVIFILFTSLFSASSFSQGDKLIAHWRDRPPYIFKDNNDQIKGVMVELLEEAVKQLGYELEWQDVPFAQSLQQVKRMKPVIVPRVRKTEEREAFVKYLGPIGYARTRVLFLVHKSDKHLLGSYEDLYKYLIGVKRGTTYNDKFDKDPRIKKIVSIDDKNMVQMFKGGRFKIMAIADLVSIQTALNNAGIDDYVFASYIIYNEGSGYYFGVPKTSELEKVYDNLNDILADMMAKGETKKFFERYGLGDTVWFDEDNLVTN
ncbi:substrate-binding periplasmic protein [Kiloniella antarctica]|uniref:Substrate-binding periplasmic protein n=1 Tax=Kiloniella antarctica TaxID=1550907 RepID=A0ABW5BIL1_9PROT